MPQKTIWEEMAPAAKVLLYLRALKEANLWTATSTGVEAFTQKGMSASLGMSIPRLSMTLVPLMKKEHVKAERVRIQGLRRRPLAYMLTPAGRDAAEKEVLGLQNIKVSCTDERGREVKTTLGKLFKERGTEGDILGLLKSAFKWGQLNIPDAERREELHDGQGQKARTLVIPKTYHPELVDLRDAIQISPHFVGRKRELDALNDFLTSSPARLFTLTGPAAIGKTSLVSRFVTGAVKTVSVAFHTCREWDTLRNVLEPIAELLNRMGRSRLQFVLQNEMQPITLQAAAELLKKDMKGIIALIIFDDIQKLSFDHRPLLKLFITSIAADDVSTGAGKGDSPTWIKVVTTSRDPLSGVFDHRDTIVKEHVLELELGGLSEAETGELLVKENAADLPVEKVYDLTAGHPLHVELITRSGLKGASRDFGKFIDNEMMVKLSADEKSVLGCLSVFKIPVPAEAIRLPQATGDALDKLVKLGLVKLTSLNEYMVPDIVSEASSRSLKLEERKLYHSVAARYHKSLRNDESTAAALRHHLSAEELPEALEVAADHAKVLIRVGRGNLLEEAVKAAKGRDMAGKDVAAECRVRSELALASGEWRMAQIYLDKALAAVKGDFKQEGRILAAQAHALREQTMLDESLKKYDDAEKVSTTVMDIPTMADVYRGQGKVHWKKGDFERAIFYMDKSLDYMKAADMDGDYGETLIDIGLVNNRMGRNEEAINYFNRGIEILEKGGYIHPLARAYNNLGVEYFQRKDYDNAIVCWEKSYEFAKKTGNKRGMVVALENLSDPYSQRGELEKALASLKTAKRLVEDTHDKIGLAAIYQMYGKVYSNVKKWDEAFENYNKAISILKEASTPFEMANILFHFGKALYENGNMNEASAKLRESMTLFTECRAEKKMKEVEDLLHKIESHPTQHPG
jgi:tetratricopeptide (TPR) repeat protein